MANNTLCILKYIYIKSTYFLFFYDINLHNITNNYVFTIGSNVIIVKNT